MPSVSRPQHNLMEGVAHNPAFAKKVGIPTEVGRDFANADAGKMPLPKKKRVRPDTIAPINSLAKGWGNGNG